MDAILRGLQINNDEESAAGIDTKKVVEDSPSRVLHRLGLIKDFHASGEKFRLDKALSATKDEDEERTPPLEFRTVSKFIVDFYFRKPAKRSFVYKEGAKVRDVISEASSASWIVLEIGSAETETESEIVRVLKHMVGTSKTSDKHPKVFLIARSSKDARFASYLSVRYGGVWLASSGDGMHNNCTAFETLIGRAETHKGPAIIVHNVHASKSNPFTMCTKPNFVWNGRAFDEVPASDDLRKLLDPSFDVLFEPATDSPFSPHTHQKDQIRAIARDRIASLNRVDPAKVVCIFYGSESPSKNAYGLASILTDLVSARGYKVEIKKLDDLCGSFDSISGKNVVVVVSTAGVGEFPSGSKKFGDLVFPHPLNPSYEGALGKDKDALETFKPRSFAVFGLGDVDYHLSERNKLDSTKTPWSFCTPAKILDAQFGAVAKRLHPVGLGGANSYKKDFSAWSEHVLASMGGGGDEEASSKVSKDAPPPLHPIELYKMTSKQLKQPLLNELLDPSRPHDISEAALQVSKHHGIYQQRRRDELYADPKAHPQCSFMIRLRMPGGTITTAQMKALLHIGETFGNHTMKITTRQTVQYHGVIKSDLIDTIHAMNRACLDTVAACGDVNRNVMCSVVRPANDTSAAVDAVYARVQQIAHEISEQLMPEGLARTWYDIWVARGRNYRATRKKDRFHIGNKEIQRAVEKGQDPEPILGKAYLPRKFKVAIAIPPFNDPDVFAHCVGFIAIVKNGRLEGFNVTAGGGMGTTKHGLFKAYARLANVIGFCKPEDAKHVALALMETQRDFGVRTDRSHARFKYTVEDLGVPRIQKEVRERMQARHRDRLRTATEKSPLRSVAPRLEKARPHQLLTNKDNFGKRINHDRTRDYTLYMQNGRIKDYPTQTNVPGRVSGVKFWTAMERVCEACSDDDAIPTRFVFSNNQNLTLSRVPEALSHRIERILDDAGIPFRRDDIERKFSPLMLNSMACVAFPTCGLAMAPSETYLPTLISKLEDIMDDFDFTKEEKNITIRMSGCPNGCSRPYVAEICLVGRSYSADVGGMYDLFLGGLPSSERLAVRYRTGLDESEILKEFRGIFKRYKKFRTSDEGRHVCFGDFVVETGIVDVCRASPIYEAHGEREPAVTFWPRRDKGVRKYLKTMYEENTDNIRTTLAQNYPERIVKQYKASLDF